MENILAIKGRIQEIYGEHTGLIDRAINVILALLAFYFINSKIGYMKMAASPFVAVGLALICAFLPRGFIVLIACGLILAHASALSLGVMGVTAGIFVVMYALYFRLSGSVLLAALLSPLAFMLKVPYLIPIVFGLTSVPVAVIPMSFGTIAFYMTAYLQKSGATLKEKSMMDGAIKYAKGVFMNKEMYVMLIAMIVCFFVVYTVRHLAINYAWKVAMVCGVLANLIIVTIGKVALKLDLSAVWIIVGNLLAIAISLVLELFFFSVDYSRREDLEFEDDNYVYYVKAVPKVAVATKQKSVRTINKSQKSAESDGTNVDDRTRVLSEGVVSKRNRQK
ncbi:hypothetical protein M2146_000029 [Lachnospiraceae bacterium PF1-22]|uniref:hypothetical protein n=1 Tax=Ohessyouella blattaphilus TaxID=2949333 RepID=UPI003E2F17EC